MEQEKKKNKTIGWILLIILIILILGLNYVKFFMNEPNENITETPVQNTTSEVEIKALQAIVDNFNKNDKIKQYEEQGIKLNAELNNHSIFISYATEETITYEFNYQSLELTINIRNDEENLTKFKKVYEILIYAVQERLENNENIDNYVKDFMEDAKDYTGLSKTVKDGSATYKMNITKKLTSEESQETALDSNNSNS